MQYIKNLFKNIDKPLYLLPLAFACISILMMISTSYDNGVVISKTVVIQTSAYLLGFLTILIITNMNYSMFEDFSKPLYIISLILLLLPYVPGLGHEMYGAKSWINIGFTTFQPSEIVKITFILLMASYLQKHKDNLNYFKDFCKASLYALPIILIVLKEDFGSAAVFLVVFIFMILFAGLDLKLFGKITVGTVVATPFLFKFLAEYQKQRITAFLYPNDLTIQANYQVWHSKVAIGSGGFFGKGLFNGTQKDLNFLPVRNSDFIFSVICEEFGFVGGVTLIALFVWFLYSIMKLAFSIGDLFGGLIVIGFLGMFAAQIFENIAMCMGLMPVTGITLPFISYGGSSVLANMISMGIILNIAISNRGVAFLK